MNIPTMVLDIWIKATKYELAKQNKTCYEMEEGEDWHDGFDANDIPIYNWCLEELVSSKERGGEFSITYGKAASFMITTLREYVRKHLSELSTEEYFAIFRVYVESCLEYENAQIKFFESLYCDKEEWLKRIEDITLTVSGKIKDFPDKFPNEPIT